MKMPPRHIPIRRHAAILLALTGMLFAQTAHAWFGPSECEQNYLSDRQTRFDTKEGVSPTTANSENIHISFVSLDGADPKQAIAKLKAYGLSKGLVLVDELEESDPLGMIPPNARIYTVILKQEASKNSPAYPSAIQTTPDAVIISIKLPASIQGKMVNGMCSFLDNAGFDGSSKNESALHSTRNITYAKDMLARLGDDMRPRKAGAKPKAARKAPKQVNVGKNPLKLSKVEICDSGSYGYGCHEELRITSAVDAIEVQSVIANRGNCEPIWGISSQVPGTLNFGTSMKFVYSGCAEIIEVEVQTDRGTWVSTF